MAKLVKRVGLEVVMVWTLRTHMDDFFVQRLTTESVSYARVLVYDLQDGMRLVWALRRSDEKGVV